MRPYIVVTRNDGVVFKRIENRLDSEHKDLWLISDNPDYPPYSVKPSEVVEVWRARGYLAFNWPTPAFSGMERIQGRWTRCGPKSRPSRQGARAGRYTPRPPLR